MESIMDLVIDVADGNPGAATVLAQLSSLTREYPLREILYWCKEKKFTGSLLWILYKDICKQQIDATQDYLAQYFMYGISAEHSKVYKLNGYEV